MNKDGRFEANDFALERNTFRPLMGWSSWMVATTLTVVAEAAKRLPCIDLGREEHVRDEWLVLDLCGNGHCDLDGVVRWIVCESRFRQL